MSIIFLVLFLLSCTSFVSSTKDDKIALLKIKNQLGNPKFLSIWSESFDFCNSTGQRHNQWDISCTGTGRVYVLGFHSVNLKAPFPDAICDLSELEYLSLTTIPGLYGPIPSCITKLFNLKQLTITDTFVSGSVPRFNQTNLSSISLQGNHLSGRIPQSLSTLQQLNSLDLSSNYLTGTIPSGLVVSGSFALLSLSNNSLTGRLPRRYGSVDFYLLDVANNKLSGDASFLFGKHKTIESINLANNKFKFDLTDVEIPTLLVELNLSHNEIFGNIPNSITSSHVTELDLSFNRLCGKIPQGISIFNVASFENNTCLCGHPLLPCSTSEPSPGTV